MQNQIDFIPDTPTVPSTPVSQNQIDFIPDNVPQGTSTPWYGSNFHDPLMNTILSAGDAWRNSYASALNAIPGVHLDMVHNSQPGTLSSTVGNIAGNIGAYLTGGGIAGKAFQAAKGIPYVEKIASALEASPDATNIVSQYAPGLARNALGNAAYGALTNQDNRTEGAEVGGLLSPAADLIPGIANKSIDASKYFMPTNYMKSILQGLGGGQSLEDAAQSVIQGVQHGYQTQKDAASELYDPVYNSVRNSDIYNPIGKKDTTIFSTQSPLGEYQNLSPRIYNNYSTDLQDLHENFISNPTFDNAHKLQSQIGVDSAALNSGIGAPDVSTISAIASLNKARSAIKNDMQSFLQNNHPELADQYQKASDYFRENVAPYRANPKIYAMATGDTANIKPSSLGNVFAAPDENLQKVLGDMPTQTINNLIYTKLGQRVPANNADAFIRNYEGLDQQGLGSYVSPELESQIQSLRNRMYARNALQYAAGALPAAALGGKFGVAEAIGGAGLGAGIGKPIMNYIQARIPLEKISRALGNASSVTYPYLKTALLANIPPQTGGQ